MEEKLKYIVDEYFKGKEIKQSIKELELGQEDLSKIFKINENKDKRV